MRIGRPVRLTGTGNVGSDAGGTCLGVVVKAGTAAGTVTVREGGAAGAVILTLTTVANGSSVECAIAFRWEGQLHVTIAGAAVEATVFI